MVVERLAFSNAVRRATAARATAFGRAHVGVGERRWREALRRRTGGWRVRLKGPFPRALHPAAKVPDAARRGAEPVYGMRDVRNRRDKAELS